MTGELLAGMGLGWLTLTVALLLFRSIRRRVTAPVDHSLLVVEYGYKLTIGKNHQDLSKLLVAQFPIHWNIQRAALLLPQDYQLVSVNSGNNEADFRLPISHAAVRWVASGGEAQQANQGRLLKLVQQSRTDLTWTCVWIPLMRGARLRGLWLLGERNDKTAYSPADLRCLTSIAREAAAVLEAMAFAEQERQTALELRTLYRQVITAREAERGNLTRELHDGVLQDLCAIARDLKALQSQSDCHEPTYADLAACSSEAVRSLRAICNDLRPPLLQQDLISALKALVQDLDSRSNAPVHIECQVDNLALDDETALAVFRITQEALNNAIVHANASEIAVCLTQYPDRLRLTITDDGRGIAGSVDSARFVPQGHFGLAGMRERAAMVGGQLHIQTAIEYGTVVILELPGSALENNRGS